MSATAQTPTAGGGRVSHPGPPWYCPTLSVHSGPDPIGRYYHSSRIGRQTDENSCGLPLAIPPPLIGADLTACLGGGLPVLMAGDLNAKHVEWNSRLKTRREKILRDNADENSCLIFGPDRPPTNPYNPYATAYVLDIVIAKDLPFQVYLTSCSALSSDHLPVLIDTACRSFFQHPPDRPHFRRIDWVDFQIQV